VGVLLILLFVGGEEDADDDTDAEAEANADAVSESVWKMKYKCHLCVFNPSNCEM
jgi:hypothetical protein